MPAHPSMVTEPQVRERVTAIIADVLMVPLADVRPQSAVINDLGAESIDFLDLVFRLEDALGAKIPLARWLEFTQARLGGEDPNCALTVALVQDFAVEEFRSAHRPPRGS